MALRPDFRGRIVPGREPTSGIGSTRASTVRSAYDSPLKRSHLARERTSAVDDDHRGRARRNGSADCRSLPRSARRPPARTACQPDRAERVERPRGARDSFSLRDLLLHRRVPQHAEYLDPEARAKPATITTASGAGRASAISGSASGKTPNVAVRRIRRGRQRNISAPVSTRPIDGRGEHARPTRRRRRGAASRPRGRGRRSPRSRTR